MPHTPGPWTAIFDPPEYFPSVAIGPVRDAAHANRGQIIINGCNPESNMKTHRANARLIAAAPDMLAALQKLDASWTETFPDGPDGGRQWAGGLGTLSDETCEIWRAIRAANIHPDRLFHGVLTQLAVEPVESIERAVPLPKAVQRLQIVAIRADTKHLTANLERMLTEHFKP